MATTIFFTASVKRESAKAILVEPVTIQVHGLSTYGWTEWLPKSQTNIIDAKGRLALIAIPGWLADAKGIKGARDYDLLTARWNAC